MILLKQGSGWGRGDICPVCPPPITQLMLVTCFLWRSTQMCALWAMVSNNQLFYISQNMHFIYFFCVNWYLNSNRQDNGVHAIFLIFQNYIWKRLRRLNFKGIISDQWNYCRVVDIKEEDSTQQKRWKDESALVVNGNQLKLSRESPLPLKAYYKSLSIISSSKLIHYIILRTSEEWRQSK